MYSDIWTPTNITTDPGNANDCVVMTVGNNSQLVWKDISCLSEEYESNGESKPIQVPFLRQKAEKKKNKNGQICAIVTTYMCRLCVSAKEMTVPGEIDMFSENRFRCQSFPKTEGLTIVKNDKSK